MYSFTYRSSTQTKTWGGTKVHCVMKFSWANSTLKTRTEMVFKTLVLSLFNHLTQLIAQED